MSIWINWTPTQLRLWHAWVAERPQVIQDIVAKYDLRMDRLYRLTPTNQHVTLYSINENGTLTVNVLAKFNQHHPSFAMLGELAERRVFGIDPADLVECDWDGDIEPGEPYLAAEGIKEDTIH